MYLPVHGAAEVKGIVPVKASVAWLKREHARSSIAAHEGEQAWLALGLLRRVAEGYSRGELEVNAGESWGGVECLARSAEGNARAEEGIVHAKQDKLPGLRGGDEAFKLRMAAAE